MDRLIVADLFKAAFSVLTVLVLIIVSRNFIKVLSKAIEGNISHETVVALLGLKIIVAASAFLPASMFIALLMVLGRMYREQEMSAVASAGGGMSTIYRSVFLMVVPLSLFAAGFSLLAGPWAEFQSAKLTHQDEQSADVRGISAGRFSEYSGGDLIFYAERIEDGGRMHNVFVQNKQGGKLGVANSEFGRLQQFPGGLYLVLEDGQRVLGVAGQADFAIEHFHEYGVLIEKKVVSMSVGSSAISTEDLWHSSEPTEVAEFQDRISVPIGVLILAFVAVPMSKLSPRGGVYGRLLIAFAVYFSFGNLQKVNHSLVAKQQIPVWLGYIWVDALVLAFGVFLLVRSYGLQWFLIKLRGDAIV
jgi:lipopolysaccharide export system permease protein